MQAGRNDPCPCGSDKKYKKCCLNKISIYTFAVTPHNFNHFSCSIRLTEDDTLYTLHVHLQEVLEWDNDHMFSFFMDNKIWNRKSEYSGNPLGDGSANISIKNLFLKEGQKFLYLFDYGDEHCFEIQLTKIQKSDDLDNLPLGLIEKNGNAPEQYECFSEEEDIENALIALDYLETNLEIISKSSNERSAENWNFMSFLKMYGGPKDIDEEVRRINDEVSGQIDCTECGNCCQTISPTLLEDDIAKLSRGLSVSKKDFIEKYLKKTEDKEFVFNKVPCPLLLENRCTQYDCRPCDCESFPHLHKDVFVSRLMDVINNCSVCPIVFNVYERLKDEFPERKKNF